MSTEDDLARAESVAAEGMRFMETAASGVSLRTKVEACVVLLIALAVGLYMLMRPAPPIPEVITAAPQVVQADRSIQVQRAPEAHPAPPPHVIPRGGVEVRRDSFVAAPAAGASSVEIDLSLVRMPDNGQRVIASSPDGIIVKAIDIPIEAGLMPPRDLPWAAGISYGIGKSIGLWVDRDIGRLRLGAAVQRRQDGHAEAQLRVGVRF